MRVEAREIEVIMGEPEAVPASGNPFPVESA